MPSLAAVRAALAERSLTDFVRQAWPLLEPATPLVWGPHLDAVCQHLQAVTEGRIRNLVVTIPPRCGKSTLVSVLWPAWAWIARPATRWLCASYAQSLAVRDSVRCRRVLESPWYQERWGDRVRLTGDQNVKTRFENEATGHRLAVSVASAVTGEGGDVLLVDDAHNVAEAESTAVRLTTLRWWDEAFCNRLNDARTGARVIIGQRVHHRDLIGHVLDQGGFEELRIPEEFEADRRCTTSLGWQDWRQADGELLRPERFGPEQVAEAKRRLGSVAYAAQHQQRPIPREGALFKAGWFRRYADLGDAWRLADGLVVRKCECPVFAVCDPAGGESSSADCTALLFFTVVGNGLLLLHASRERVSLERIPTWLRDECQLWQPDYVGVETGFFQGQLIRAVEALPGTPPVRRLDPGGRSKLARAVPAVVLAEAGRIHLPAAAVWLDTFMAELLVFTGIDDAHDDQVDCLSYAARELERMGPAYAGEPFVLGQRRRL